MTQPVLGIIGALDLEIQAIAAALSETSDVNSLGCQITDGWLDGQPISLVRSGVGKVKAALATAAMAEHGVPALVMVGTAGALEPSLKVGDAVIATDLVQHDVDITAFGHAPGVIEGSVAGGLADVELSQRLEMAAASIGATIHRGRIVSGDQFITSRKQSQAIADQFQAIAVEMEGAAVAQACQQIGLPLAVLRWISDSADEGALGDFEAFAAQVAELDLAIIRQLVARWTR